MKTFDMYSLFGSVCGDGARAISFLESSVIPSLEQVGAIEFNFQHVRVINSSFSNALFGNLIKDYGLDILKCIRISEVSPLVKSEIKSGIAYGAKYSKRSVAA